MSHGRPWFLNSAYEKIAGDTRAVCTVRSPHTLPSLPLLRGSAGWARQHVSPVGISGLVVFSSGFLMWCFQCWACAVRRSPGSVAQAGVMSALMKLRVYLRGGCCLSAKDVQPVRPAVSLQMAHDTAVLSRESCSSQAARFGTHSPDSDNHPPPHVLSPLSSLQRRCKACLPQPCLTPPLARWSPGHRARLLCRGWVPHTRLWIVVDLLRSLFSQKLLSSAIAQQCQIVLRFLEQGSDARPR